MFNHKWGGVQPNRRTIYQFGVFQSGVIHIGQRGFERGAFKMAGVDERLAGRIKNPPVYAFFRAVA